MSIINSVLKIFYTEISELITPLFSNTCVQLPLVLVFLGTLAIRELQVYPVKEKTKIVFRFT